MIKGITVIPTAHIRKITIEKAKEDIHHTPGYVHLYTDDADQTIKTIFDVSVKSLYPPELLNGADNNGAEYYLKYLFSNAVLIGKKFISKDSFEKFLVSSKADQLAALKKSAETPVKLLGHIGLLEKYISVEDGVHYIDVPTTFSSYYNFIGINPSFLAYAFALKSDDTIIGNHIASEIIFDGGAIPKKTGYFTLSGEYQYKGIDGTTTGAMIAPYGAIGDMWVGPYHFQPTTPGSGEYRAMAGAEHTHDNTHPYLDYNIVSNNKIIDTRVVAEMEKLFKYNSSEFQQMLATEASFIAPVYTGGKDKNTIDELVSNKGIAIVSEACYSLAPGSSAPHLRPHSTSNTNIFFAIDKMKLLKQTTELPGLLDKLINANSSFGNILVNNLNIFHFEISKTNIQSGVKNLLLMGNNDKSFNDFDAVNYLGHSISKGYSLQQKTNDILINNKRNVALYEFREEHVNKYDDGTYFYEIKLKFRDPLIQYLSDRLAQIGRALREIDELQTKTTLKIYDNSVRGGRFVDVFDRYQNKLNEEFVKDALKPIKERVLGRRQSQLRFTYSFVDEIPESVNSAFPSPDSNNFIGFNNLNSLLLGLNSYDGIEPVSNFDTPDGTATQKLMDLISYIRNSLTLSSTTPTRIGNVRSLLFLLETRITNSLKLYTTEKITKQDVGFTSGDYETSQGNTNNTTEHVVGYTHKFNKLLDLSKTKNSFNWVKNVGQATDIALKTISKGDYINAVQSSANIILTDSGKEKFGAPSNFSYSFLPYSMLGTDLDLFNSTKIGYKIKHLQTIRKALIDRITGTPESVVTPEILAQFGIRFTTSLEEAMDTIVDKAATLYKLINYKDNFGTPSEPAPKSRDTGKQNNKFFNSFGSAKDPAYEWAGDSINHYPLVLADSIINLIFSDNLQHFRDLDFFNESYVEEVGNVFQNKEIPYLINLFSTGLVSDYDSAKEYIDETMLKAIFYEEDGQLKISNYALYVILLGLFGRVYYLEGFKQRPLSAKLTPSSFVDRNMITAMNWVPVTKGALDQITPRRSLLCKVELFENSPGLDEKIINLFPKIF